MRAAPLALLLATCTPAPRATPPTTPPPTVTVPPDPSPEPTPTTEPPTKIIAETKLPKTTDPILEPSTLLVTITAKGDFLVDGTSLPDAAALQKHAETRATADPDTRVIITADPTVRYARVIEAMDALRNGGLSHFAFAVRSPQTSPPAPPPP